MEVAVHVGYQNDLCTLPLKCADTLTLDCFMWVQSLHVANLPCAFDWVLT